MDAAQKEQWKWKFYRLALHLNAVILSIALTVAAALKAPDPYRISLTAALLLIDILLVVTFRRNYAAAKAWLGDHAGTKQDAEATEAG